MYKSISTEEKIITGKWLLHNNKMIGDDNTKRIEWLIKNSLIHIKDISNGWESVYKDPNDMRIWKLTYPQSHLHGGGPPQLINISLEEE